MTTEADYQKACAAMNLREANRRIRELREAIEKCGSKIETDAKVIAALREALADCAADLEAELLAKYTPADCAAYPDIKRRRDRDMATVTKARARLSNEQLTQESET